MTPRERVLAALAHRTPDHTPSDDSMDDVLERLGVDLRVIEAPHIRPALRTWPGGRFENIWGHIRKPVRNEAGSYDEAVEYP